MPQEMSLLYPVKGLRLINDLFANQTLSSLEKEDFLYVHFISKNFVFSEI